MTATPPAFMPAGAPQDVGDGWPLGSLGAGGFDAEQVQRHIEAAAYPLKLHGVLIARRGTLLADALAEGGRKAAVDAGVHFVDMRGQFTGHGACGTDPWIHGLNLTESAATFHPNAAGQDKGYAAKFKSLWG